MIMPTWVRGLVLLALVGVVWLLLKSGSDSAVADGPGNESTPAVDNQTEGLNAQTPQPEADGL